MRNFVLLDAAQSLLTGAVANLSAVAEGQIGLLGIETDISTGKYTAYDDSSLVSGMKRYQFVVGQGSDIKPIVLPFYHHHFSYSKMVYAAATTFVGTVTIPDPAYVGEYTIIVVKKGVQFNERNKWSAQVYVKDTAMTAATLADKLVASINNNSEGSGVSAAAATVSTTTTITITAAEAGVDYEIIVADSLAESGATVSVTTRGIPAVADDKMIEDMANKAAADAGYTDTYQDGAALLYPKYPITRSVRQLGQYGFTVFTLRFAEPRDMKTRDDIVHQIIQIAVPNTSTGAGACVSDLDDLLAALV